MKYIAICGASQATAPQLKLAEEVGRLIAQRGAVLVCGGMFGVTEAASRGAKEAGGTVIGLLPGEDRQSGNPHVTVPIATGLGHLRNTLIVRTSDAVIAIGGGWGTLSEIAFANVYSKPIVGLVTWDVEGLRTVDTPEEAVAIATG